MALIGGTWFEKKKIKIKLMLEGTLICDMKMCNRKIVWLFFFYVYTNLASVFSWGGFWIILTIKEKSCAWHI